MSRANHTAVSLAKVQKVMEKAGLECKANKGWLKYHPAGQGIKRAIGVPTTKSVTRVELVGFTHELGVAHPKPPAKTVEQMVDFCQDEKLVLRALWKIASSLAASSKPAPVEEPASPPAEQPASTQAA